MTSLQDLLGLLSIAVLLLAFTQFLKEKEYFQATTDTKPTDTKPSETKCEECPGCGLWTYIGSLGIIVAILYVISLMATSPFFQTLFLFQMIGNIFRA